MGKAKVKAVETRRGIEREYLGEAIHTAMRKICDSNPSSLVYNIIHLCISNKENGWSEYLDNVWDELGNESQSLWVCAKRAGERLAFGNSERTALRLSMALMSKDDWEGAVAFLEPENL